MKAATDNGLGTYEEVELHGQQVSFQAAGSGDQVVVLLHGITSTAEAWREVMPRLAERYTVIAPDLIGHGRSAKPRGDYSLGAYAAGVRDLLAVLGFERGTVVGHSLRRRDRHAVLLPLPRVRRADGADLLRRPRAGRSTLCSAPPPCPAPSGCCR